MDLNGENIKKIRGLILFTAVLVVCLWKYDVVFSVLKFILGVTFPFILGGAFAFVLNVPMNFLQRHLFPRKITQKSRALQKLARPASLVLVLLLVVGVVGLVLFVLIPQLGSTFGSLGRSIRIFIPQVQKWTEELFRNNVQISSWLQELNFDWNHIMEMGVSFFRNGAGSMLDSTITVARGIISGLTTFFIAFVFALLHPAPEGEAERAGAQSDLRLHPKREGGGAAGGVHADVQHFFQLPHRAVCGGHYPGHDVRGGHDGLPYALRASGGPGHRSVRADPHLRGLYRLRHRGFPDLHGEPPCRPSDLSFSSLCCSRSRGTSSTPMWWAIRWDCPPSGCWRR